MKIVYTPEQKERRRLAASRYRHRHPDRIALYKKTHLDSFASSEERKIYAADWSRRYRYGIKPDEWKKLCKKGCEICGSKKRRLCVDHDHNTGIVRGVLCNVCNTGIGSFKDNLNILKKAVLYLEKTN